jgi:hypothetical protein
LRRIDDDAMATVQVSKGEMEPSNEKQDLPSSEVSQDYKLALYNKASSSKCLLASLRRCDAELRLQSPIRARKQDR